MSRIKECTIPDMTPVICLMGPTACGKTKIAIELTQELPCDIISVDSSMVYRGMDIGSAKPTPDEQKLAPHRLIDIRNPDEIYSAGDFQKDALREMDDILAQNRIPLLVGGTMLYFKALQQGLAELPQANAEIRAEIEAEAKQLGWQALHDRLAQIDPESAERIHPNDPQRLQRALEIYAITGKTMTQLFAENKQSQPQYNFINIAIASESRALLNERIEIRFKQMLEQGLIAEVEKLVGNYPNMPTSMRAVNYRQVCQYLSGELSYDEMIERAVIATRQLAKRQMTWLRAWPDLVWINSSDENITTKIKEKICQKTQ